MVVVVLQHGVIFQSTLPRGERRKRGRFVYQKCYFNPRSREGSDGVMNALMQTLSISIHAPARGATVADLYYIICRGFQSTLPRGERLPLISFVWLIMDFNPRSREGSDGGLFLFGGNYVYFNPRSREGSDFPALPPACMTAYFNPRSREGSDLLRQDSSCGLCDFNPRSREGSDNLSALNCDLNVISIHAPARGATAIFTQNLI